MAKSMIALGILILIINIIIIADSQAQATPSSLDEDSASAAVNGIDEAISKNKPMEILGVDPSSFPKMKVNIYIDKFCAMTGNLKKEDFKADEDGKEVAINNLFFTGNASGHKLDLAIVFDDTGSMGEEISAMKLKVADLTDSIKVSGMDANYSLVSFKDKVSVQTPWTNDPVAFKKCVSALHQTGGGDEPEVSLDAIEAVLAMDFRPDAQRIILVITDAHAHFKDDGSTLSNYTKEEIENDLKKSGVIFIPVSPTFKQSSSYVDLRAVANDIQSTWIDINSADFSTILEQFQGILTGTYVIEYTSPDQTEFGKRNVSVSVNAPGCIVGSDSGSYDRPGRPNVIPIITDLRAVQDNETNISYTANATDPDGDQILYRYFLNNKSVTDWGTDNKWTLNTADANVGENRIEVRIRDGKHAGPDGGFDDKKSIQFTPSSTDKTWMRTFGGLGNDSADSVEQTSDGGYIVAGETESFGAGGKDVWLIKADANGNKLWDRTFGGSMDDSANSVQQTRDGGYIIAGMTDGTENWLAKDMWLIKTDAEGNKQWDKILGGPNPNDNDEASFVQQTSDGGYIITGWNLLYGAGIGAGLWNVKLIKTDANGSILWDRTFGGPDIDLGRSVQQTTDGGYIIAGVYGKGNTTVGWLIKTDDQGNELWNKTLRDKGSVRQTNDGGYIIAGWYDKGNYRFARMTKTDSQGNELWNKTLGGSGWNVADSVQQTSDGGYIIAGNENGDYWLIKSDASGNKQWDKTFGGWIRDLAGTVEQTSDGGYIIVGQTKSYGAGGTDVLLIKTDAEGNLKESLSELKPRSASDWVCQSSFLGNQGKYEEALQSTEKAIELDPNYAMAWNNKAAALNGLGRNNESLQASEKAIGLDPNLALAWDTKAEALNGLGRNNESLQASEKAIELDPTLADAWNNKGEALKALGRTTEADAAFTKAKELGYVAR